MYCGISAHGFGHLAQTAPVLQALHKLHPNLELVIQSELDAGLLANWIKLPFELVHLTTDPGVSMMNAMQVDSPLTRQTYREQWQDWPQLVANQAASLRVFSPDLVLTNNSFLLSAAAASISVPSIHFCSLNWADIYAAYAGEDATSLEIINHVTAAYNLAEMFIRFTPGLPMPKLRNVVTVGVVGREGVTVDLSSLCSLPPATRFVLVSMGGMPYPIPFSAWPELAGVTFLIAETLARPRADFVNFTSLGLNHIDLTASCHAIVTKPGYGTFTEAALHHKPVLYLSRQDWPEEPWLADWLDSHVPNQVIEKDQLLRGDLAAALQSVWNAATKAADTGTLRNPANTGASEAALLIADYLT